MNTFPNLNRTIVLIEGKQPFYDWINSVFPSDEPLKPEDTVEHNSYLLESELYFEEPKEALQDYWKDIFENELFDMCTDPNDWPKISWSLFNKYFQCHFSSIVHDLGKDSLKQETFI
ncbi:hypothetical protein ITJ86_04375 [Winogradskyella sp. F6397]|uniref:Uncharacterized protein n=1 Tax=Winogradskyella marina TaxID=2785530 RepID=A0ABS0EFT1_9FLAO|nr:hypothetical protein [Winogradskyella marina]MBF8149118.1 hypothetical protein [Winogradskyella marina]